MKLDSYLNAQGKALCLALEIGVTTVQISQWKTGVRQVPAERCPAIEKATGGLVTCEEMRPDVDWGYLRQREDARLIRIYRDPRVQSLIRELGINQKVSASEAAPEREAA